MGTPFLVRCRPSVMDRLKKQNGGVSTYTFIAQWDTNNWSGHCFVLHAIFHARLCWIVIEVQITRWQAATHRWVACVHQLASMKPLRTKYLRIDTIYFLLLPDCRYLINRMHLFWTFPIPVDVQFQMFPVLTHPMVLSVLPRTNIYCSTSYREIVDQYSIRVDVSILFGKSSVNLYLHWAWLLPASKYFSEWFQSLLTCSNIYYEVSHFYRISILCLYKCFLFNLSPANQTTTYLHMKYALP